MRPFTTALALVALCVSLRLQGAQADAGPPVHRDATEAAGKQEAGGGGGGAAGGEPRAIELLLRGVERRARRGGRGLGGGEGRSEDCCSIDGCSWLGWDPTP